MDKFIRKLKRLLREQFPGCDPIIEPADTRVGGLLVWKGFDRMEHLKRQRILWAMLREKLSKEDMLKVGGILTVSTLEMSVARS